MAMRFGKLTEDHQQRWQTLQGDLPGPVESFDGADWFMTQAQLGGMAQADAAGAMDEKLGSAEQANAYRMSALTVSAGIMEQWARRVKQLSRGQVAHVLRQLEQAWFNVPAALSQPLLKQLGESSR